MPPLNSKTEPIHLLHLNNIHIFEQLQLEEALLRADNRNWCIINTGSAPAIVMGISGKPELLINRQQFSQHPVPLIKRFSGGGTVFIDEHTVFVTWICNTYHSGVDCCPTKIHSWSAQFYQTALPSIEMELKENDYVIGNKKFGGNAQYLCKGRWLHHTSFLWDYEPHNMEYLTMPSKIPNYRQNRSHHEFLCKLSHHIDKDDLEKQIVHSLHSQFEVNTTSMKLVENIKFLPHRKATQYIKLN